VNIIDRMELEIENFVTATGVRPTRIKLGKGECRQLNVFRYQYSSHADPKARGNATRNYEGIPIEETNVEDQLDLE
jgi:hypothetical protein